MKDDYMARIWVCWKPTFPQDTKDGKMWNSAVRIPFNVVDGAPIVWIQVKKFSCSLATPLFPNHIYICIYIYRMEEHCYLKKHFYSFWSILWESVHCWDIYIRHLFFMKKIFLYKWAKRFSHHRSPTGLSTHRLTWGIRDDKGIARTPLVETLIKDLEERDHAFQFSKVDAHGYLLPQRRNRVFGVSSAKGLKTPEQVALEQQTWKTLFGKLGLGPKEHHFTLEDFLEPDLDSKPLQAPQDVRNWKAILKQCKSKLQLGKDDTDTPICMHMGSSENRLEFMMGASTCVRPSHDIFCGLVERPFVGIELLRLQGSFESDYPYPEELQALPYTLARDLAGNAFPTTVLQANVIASLVSHHAWREMAQREDFASPPRQSKQLGFVYLYKVIFYFPTIYFVNHNFGDDFLFFQVS